MSECEPLSRPHLGPGCDPPQGGADFHAGNRVTESLSFHRGSRLNALVSGLTCRNPKSRWAFTVNITAGLKNGIPLEVRHVSHNPPPPPAEFYSPPLGQRREIVLDTLVCRCLSRCCSCSSLLYPGGLTLKSRSLTIARNSFLLSSQ